MLDMGFKPDIEKMESHASMPRKGRRQTLMFSATFPDAIQRAASNFLDNYLFLKVGLVGAANSDVRQTIFRCQKFEKREKLLSIVSEIETKEKTLIFVQQKKMTDFLASYLCQNEVKKIMNLLSESGSGKIRLAYLKVMFIRTDNKEALNIQ